MNIAFTMGSEKISGGTYVIFEHAVRINRLNGYNVTIITDHLVDIENDLAWHPDAGELKWSTYDNCKEKYDIVVCTWWRTVYEASKILADNYCYFVQSIESKFYREDSDNIIRKLVDSTYCLGLPIITEATWIKKYLSDNYQTQAYLVKNGIRKDIYTREGESIEPQNKDKVRLLVEGPLGVSFKNTEKALELAKKSNVDEVWLMTSTQIESHKLADRVFSQVPIFETTKIYRSCDFVLKLSYVEGMFGPPLEMFHCGGTAIVYDVTGHDEYLIGDYNSFVVKTDDEQQVIDYINLLCDDKEKLNQLKHNAKITADNWHGWDVAADKFRLILEEIVAKGTIAQAEFQSRANFFFDWYVIAENYRLAAVVTRVKNKFKKIVNKVKKIYS